MVQDHSHVNPAPEVRRDVVDARGLNCPLPVLRLRKRLLAGATAVELLATDRATLRDVPAFCAAQGYDVKVITDTPDVLRFLVRRPV